MCLYVLSATLKLASASTTSAPNAAQQVEKKG